MSVFGFAQNNHLNLHFNGGTSGFQLIDNGGTLIDIYDALIHEQENGMFYNASVSYLGSAEKIKKMWLRAIFLLIFAL